MYPRERSLVKRMKGKPFVLLGVKSDPREHLRETIKREHITWRSWWDGGSPRGPIATRWGVDAWPTIYLIDQRGVVRSNLPGEPGDPGFDRALEKLVRGAEEHKHR